MQAQDSQSCIHCQCPWRYNAMRYLLTDMANEMQTWVELKLKYEVNADSWLCEKCFASFRSTWASIQEPEVEIEPGLSESNSDPLTGMECLSEEVIIKQEERESIEHYDYKIEIDNSKPSTSCGVDEKESSILEQNIRNMSPDTECENDEKTSSDDEPDKDELSSEDNDTDAPVLDVPQLLNGSQLKCGSKCDCCKTLLKGKEYRKIMDGPVKEYLVVRSRFDREVSPERICNYCWNRAYEKVLKEKKKEERAEEPVEDKTDPRSTITIPGYRRCAASSRTCIVHGTECSERNRIPKYIRVLLLKSYNLFVPDVARMCRELSKEYCRDWSFLNEKRLITTFTTEQVTEMLNLLRDEALKYPE